jgi:hypothetical protein
VATGNYVLDKGYIPAAALTKFMPVKLTAAETVGPIAANSDVVHGFAQFDVASSEITRGKQASVRIMGITEAVAAGAIAVGVAVQLEATGQVSAAVGASGKRLVGRCVGHPSSVAGDRISLLFDPTGGVA